VFFERAEEYDVAGSLSDYTMSLLLRTFLILTGLGIVLLSTWSLHDGHAVLGIPGRNTQSAPSIVHLDAWPELLITAVILGALSVLLILAGVSPRQFHNTPAVPLLVVLVLVLLVAIPFLTSVN
jgi:cell division protein FtsW (lipid II flippase)